MPVPQGCPANVVTWNTLIDVYGKSGQWEEALGGERRGAGQAGRPGGRASAGRSAARRRWPLGSGSTALLPRLPTCSARPDEGGVLRARHPHLQVSERLLRGTQGWRCRCWQGGLAAATPGTGTHGRPPSVQTPTCTLCSTLMIACNTSNQWQEALRLHEEMAAAGLPPNTTTYNALISGEGCPALCTCRQQAATCPTRRGCQPQVCSV